LEIFEVWYLGMSLKARWGISLISVWGVWSVLWRTSLFLKDQQNI